MNKIDFKKEYKELYKPSKAEFQIIDVPPMQFLMIDGRGDPNIEPVYQEALEALYAVAYKIKFNSKKDHRKDYVVPPLEGLWWADDIDTFTLNRDKSAWQWTMMIMQPDWITRKVYQAACAAVKTQKDPPALPLLRLETYNEGLSVQIMHIGSYDDEGPALHKLHSNFIPDNNLEMSGLHHEIYLSDPRRVPPEKLKTILRQPVRRIEP